MVYEEDEYDYLFKVVLMGDFGVGKFNILFCVVFNFFVVFGILLG